jgi:NAD(P)H-flavin reductase
MTSGVAQVRVEEREPVGGGLLRVRLAVPSALARTHRHHGQYVEVQAHAGEVRGFFVIASAPGASSWDLIVRTGGEMGDRLRSPQTAEVLVSGALGPGFPLEEAEGRPLLLAATGSAIGAVLSAAGARIASGEASRTFFVYGVRDRGELALAAELAAMRASQLDVAVALSREHVHEPGFFQGYVQHVAQMRGWDLRGGLAFVAGNEAMIAAMREAAGRLQLAADGVRVNA